MSLPRLLNAQCFVLLVCLLCEPTMRSDTIQVISNAQTVCFFLLPLVSLQSQSIVPVFAPPVLDAWDVLQSAGSHFHSDSHHLRVTRKSLRAHRKEQLQKFNFTLHENREDRTHWQDRTQDHNSEGCVANQKVCTIKNSANKTH